MISSSYNEKEEIVYVKREGTVSIQQILESTVELDSLYGHMDKVYIIEDIRGSKSLFNKEDYPTILELLKTKLGAYKMVCMADIVDDPTNTALSFMFGSLAASLDNYFYSTFSTLEAAKRWINNHR